MQKVIWFYILVVIGVFACACSQILLKKSADKEHKNFLKSMLNWRVVIAYALFFLSLFINVYAMSNGLNLKDLPILESLGYIFVPLLSYVLLNEKITRNTIMAMVLIIVGIFIFYL